MLLKLELCVLLLHWPLSLVPSLAADGLGWAGLESIRRTAFERNSLPELLGARLLELVQTVLLPDSSRADAAFSRLAPNRRQLPPVWPCANSISTLSTVSPVSYGPVDNNERRSR